MGWVKRGMINKSLDSCFPVETTFPYLNFLRYVNWVKIDSCVSFYLETLWMALKITIFSSLMLHPMHDK